MITGTEENIKQRMARKAAKNAAMVQTVEDIILKVPEGTVIMEAESGKVIADMSGENRRQVVLKRRSWRKRQSALCNSYHAGTEICPAWDSRLRSLRFFLS